jgi:hypothetical protein
MATAGKKTDLGTSDFTLFDSTTGAGAEVGTPCRTFWVANDNPSGDVLVNVDPLHAAGEYFYVAAGKEQPFGEGGAKRIRKVVAKGASGAANAIRYGVVAQ